MVSKIFTIICYSLLKQVEVLAMEKNESLISRRSFPSKGPGSLLVEKYSSPTALASQLSNGSSQRTGDSASRQNLASAIEQHGSGRLSLSESSLNDPNTVTSNISLRKQFHNEEEYNTSYKMAKAEDESYISQVISYVVLIGWPSLLFCYRIISV